MTVAHSRRQEKYYLSALDECVLGSGGKVVTFDPHDAEEFMDSIGEADILLDYAELVYYLSEQVAKTRALLDKDLIVAYTGNSLRDLGVVKANFLKGGVRARFYSEYAATEIGPIACSDVADSILLKCVYPENAFVEVLDPKTHLPSGEGRVVVTALNRTGSVFIRYDLGDIARLLFEEGSAYLEVLSRGGLKVASVFFTPDHLYHVVRTYLKQPVFCGIRLDRKKYKTGLVLSIVSERPITEREQEGLYSEILDKLEFVDDVGLTVELLLNFEYRQLSENELRKGFSVLSE